MEEFGCKDGRGGPGQKKKVKKARKGPSKALANQWNGEECEEVKKKQN